MPEVFPQPVPELEELEPKNRVVRLARSVGNKTLDLLGRDTVLSTKERLITGASLGAVAVAATVAEYKYGAEFRNASFPLGFLVFSGRHFLVGNLGAARVNAQSKFNSFKGIMAASMAADVVAEAGQSAVFTGLVHNGWENVPGFIYPNQVFWGNAKDAAAALLAGGAVYARQQMVQRKALRAEEISLPMDDVLIPVPAQAD